ncbi:hypothetical protein [Helicobacter sp. T3_23-1059]
MDYSTDFVDYHKSTFRANAQKLDTQKLNTQNIAFTAFVIFSITQAQSKKPHHCKHNYATRGNLSAYYT